MSNKAWQVLDKVALRLKKIRTYGDTHYIDKINKSYFKELAEYEENLDQIKSELVVLQQNDEFNKYCLIKAKGLSLMKKLNTSNLMQYYCNHLANMQFRNKDNKDIDDIQDSAKRMIRTREFKKMKDHLAQFLINTNAQDLEHEKQRFADELETRYTSTIDEQKSKIHTLETSNNEHQVQIAELKQKKKDIKGKLAEAEKQQDKLAKKLDQQNALNQQNNETIEELTKIKTEKALTISNLEVKVKEKDSVIVNLEESVKAHENKISKLRLQTQEDQETIAKLQEESKAQNVEIENIFNRLPDLSEYSPCDQIKIDSL